MRNVLILSLAFLLLTGCATQMPSLAGKTSYKQTFRDVETGGNTTEYSLEIKAPAGVKLDDLTGMKYTWDPEKGEIAINKSGATDTTGQAAAIVQTNQRIMDSLDHANDNAAGLVRDLAPIAAPLIGQQLTNKATSDAADAVNKAQLQQLIAEAVKAALAQKPVKPAPVVTPPVVSEPVLALPK